MTPTRPTPIALALLVAFTLPLAPSLAPTAVPAPASPGAGPAGPVPATRAQTADDLDAYWAEASRTVREGDFEGYAALYHPDAVLVSDGSGTSYPIGDALDGWEQGFVDTREGRATADVEFRITERLRGETTSHDTGIFRYSFTPEGGETSVSLVHFEALLVRKDGRWVMMMERQMDPATEAEWEAAG